MYMEWPTPEKDKLEMMEFGFIEEWQKVDP